MVNYQGVAVPGMVETHVGFVGLTNPHAGSYLESLEVLPVELTAGVGADDCDGEAKSNSDAVRTTYEDPETMFQEEELDAVWLSLSNRATPDVIELAAEYGLHVFAEKTLARNASELAEVIKTVEDAGIVVVAGYLNRANSVPRELRSLVADDFFGDLRAVEARMITSQLDRYRDTSGYVYDRTESRGGILQWLGCHMIDLLYFILNEPITRVNAQVQYGATTADVEDGATIQYELAESKALGTLQAGYYDREYDMYLAIHGMDGRAAWPRKHTPLGQEELHIEEFADNYSVTPDRTYEYDFDEAPGYGGTIGLAYMQNFLSRINGESFDTDLNADIQDAHRVLRFLDAVYESAETGVWVEVEQVRE